MCWRHKTFPASNRFFLVAPGNLVRRQQTIGYDRWLDPFFSFQPTFGRNLLLLVRHGDSF
jgi:hypothetical protein